jgi:regulatory protein
MDQDHEYLLTKIRGFCAYQERCVHDVEEKLREWKVGQKHVEQIIEQLIKEDYLNEERFAKSFAGGKFRINHWGKTKIINELERRRVPDLIIQIGLEEINDEEYEETLKEILQRKNREIKESDPWKRKQKLISYGAQKGYDFGLLKRVLEEFNIKG